MKKVSFIGIVVLLLCMIICLIGYNSLTIKQEREKYKETSQYNQEPEKKSRIIEELSYHILSR